MTHYNSDFEPLSDTSLDLETSGASQATFSQSVKTKIRAAYDDRCVICLNNIQTSQCAHIIDTSSAGEQQVLNAIKLGVLPDDHERNAETNGMVQCPTCRSCFTANDIVLSLPIPVLKYLEQYLTHTPKANRKSIYEVFSLLVDASLGAAVELPDIEPILPYIGLFTMVVLKPARVTGRRIATPYLPNVSTISGSTFVEASSNTLPAAENAARIFNSIAINNDTPLSPGVIPLSPQDHSFTETRYWRFPVSAAAVFAALIERLAYNSSECEDIRLAHIIFGVLTLQRFNAYPIGGSEPSGGGGRPSGGGGRGSKRKDTGNSPSSGKGKKKARTASDGGSGTGDCGEPNKAGVRSQNGQCHHQEITPSSSCSMEAPVELIDASWNDTDLESSRSVSAISPHDEDDPATWRFGPSFSTNKIVFTATAVNLTV